MSFAYADMIRATRNCLHDEVVALGPGVVEEAMRFIEKNRQAGVVGSQEFKLIDPHPEVKHLDDAQRTLWALGRRAVTDEVPCGSRYDDHQMLLIVQGEAGTGKSRVIKCWQNDPDFQKHGLVVAPTGIAAAPAGGRTFHSAFKTPVGTSSNYRTHIVYSR